MKKSLLVTLLVFLFACSDTISEAESKRNSTTEFTVSKNRGVKKGFRAVKIERYNKTIYVADKIRLFDSEIGLVYNGIMEGVPQQVYLLIHEVEATAHLSIVGGGTPFIPFTGRSSESCIAAKNIASDKMDNYLDSLTNAEVSFSILSNDGNVEFSDCEEFLIDLNGPAD